MSRRPDRLPDPQDVVSGKVRVRVEQLFALIHEVNPTDRALPPREKAARYALKSKLQSLLVREHAEVLVVEPAGDGVVTLRHRIAGRDAAHAVLAELDADARRWAETQLLLPSPVPTPAPAAPRAERRADALSKGRAALDDYDYETARACFEEALTSSRSPEPARALLDLLVNTLADDAGAVALEVRLPPEVLADVEVRTGLALAAARLGDRSRAARLARGVSAPDVLALLADLALREGDVPDAQRLAATLRETDPLNPAIARLTEALVQARRAERRPLEEKLAESGDETLAREILARWPDSEPARRVVREADARARHAEARKLADSAYAAWSRGDPESAGALAHRARALAHDDPDLLAWLTEAEEAAEEAETAAAFARAREEVDADRFDAFLALDLVSRARLRAEIRRPALAWVEEVRDEAAVLALERAMREPERALDLLTPHAKTLRPLPEARRLLADAEARAGEERHRSFAASLDAAEEAWLAGDPSRADVLARGLDLRVASPAERARHQELLRLVAEDLARRAAESRVEALARAGDLVAARDLARASGLAERARVHEAAVRERFLVQVVRDAGEVPIRDVWLPEEDRWPAVWLAEDGARMYFTSVASGRVFVRVLDAGGLGVVEAVSLRVPLATTSCVSEVRGGLLTVVGGEGWVLQLQVDDWEVRRWLPPPFPLRVRAACLAVGGRYLWVTTDDNPPETLVFDLGDWPRVRQRNLPGSTVPVLGADTMVRLLPEGGFQTYAPNGVARMKKPTVLDLGVDRVTLIPDDSGGFIGFGDISDYKLPPLLRSDGSDPERVERPLGMFFFLPSQQIRFSAVSTVGREDPYDVATSVSEGAYFIKQRLGDLARLRVCEVHADGIAEVGQAVLDPTATFLRDAASLRFRVVGYRENGLSLMADTVPEDLDPDQAMEREREDVLRNGGRAVLDLAGLVAPFTCATEDAGLLEVTRRLADRRWPDAAAAWRALDPRLLPRTSRRHAHHVGARALLYSGDLEGAKRALALAESAEGSCRLGALRAVIEALGGGGEGILAEYVRLLVDADGVADDPVAVSARVDHAWMWRATERQGMVRLADAWLRMEPGTPVEALRKRMVLATICDWDARGLGVDLPIGRHLWDVSRWREVVVRARRVIDAM